MAVDFVKIDNTVTTAKFAGDLMTLVRLLRESIDQLDLVKDIMDHSNDGSDFTQVETLFGLPSGQGQTVYDLVNGTFLAITGSAQNANTVSLISRVG